MKKNRQHFLTVLLILLVVTIGFCASNYASVKEKVIETYLGQGDPCVYYDTFPEEGDPLPENFCYVWSRNYSNDVTPVSDSFVDKIIERDFSGYRRVSEVIYSWRGYDAEAHIKNAGGGQMKKEVWLCSGSSTPSLSNKTGLLALCAFRPNEVGAGYGSIIQLYAFRESPLGVVSRRLYREVADSLDDDPVNVVFSVDFSAFNYALVTNVRKHLIRNDRQVKEYSSLFTYRNRTFEPLLAFESFSESVGSEECKYSVFHSPLKVTRMFVGEACFVEDGSTLFLYETRTQSLGGEPTHKAIPFVFDSKNWSLKRKFPRQPEDDC